MRPAVLFSWAAVLLDDVSEQGPRLLRFLLLAQRALQERKLDLDTLSFSLTFGL